MRELGGLLIIVIVAIAASILHRAGQLGGGLPQVTIDNRYEDPYYLQQYRELDSVDNFLNRPLKPRDKETEALVAVEEGPVRSRACRAVGAGGVRGPAAGLCPVR